ncbi:cyclophilin-like domain-containing protein [Pelagophyceae sp. CCMP2097]|nr:cyclophilin-like domain-containing protein [Pelagophyceae sp. CCMP2097]
MRAVVSTDLGRIALTLRPDAAPVTVSHFISIAPNYSGCCFYRSDFVIQCGLQRPDGTALSAPAIPVNESQSGAKLSNKRGTAAFGHWDVPDNGSSDWFINLQANDHLDDAYGGYAVFAHVEDGDSESSKTMDAIQAAVLAGSKPVIRTIDIN